MKHSKCERSPRSTGAGPAAWLIAALGCVSASSQPVTADLVKDLNTGASADSSYPETVGVLSSGIALLTAFKPTTGRELYRYDVATGALALVKDINPGAGSSSVDEVTIVGAVALFRAFSPSSGWELWRSDGTAAGTWIVRDLWPGVGGSYPRNLVHWNGSVYFVACPATNDCALWRSDGTTAGTVAVKPGMQFISNPGPLGAAYKGRLYFGAAAQGGEGFELWATDGTGSGTFMVRDIYPGGTDYYRYSSNPDGFVVAGTTLYFRAYGPEGRELWKSDGTGAGTAMVKDLAPGMTSWGEPNGGYPSDLSAVGDRLVFFASTANWWEWRYWTSDGTDAGTVPLLGSTGGIEPCDSPIYDSTRVPAGTSTVRYLAAAEPVSGCEIWRTDGTDVGTALVKDIAAGSTWSSPSNLTMVAGQLFFSANDGSSGGALWKSDGTADGTILVKDINPSDYYWTGPQRLRSAGSVALFSANDGVHGSELWRSDGTAAGTELAADIWASNLGSWPRDLVSTGGWTYFAAKGDDGWALWRTDGTPGGTLALLTVPGGGCWRGIADPVVAGSRLFFVACNEGRIELWVTDGTVAGTAMSASFQYIFPAPVEFRGRVYFGAFESDDSFGLWTSDGTAAGTYRISGTPPVQMLAVGSTLYFTANDATTGVELWKTDGTTSGTVMVQDIYPGFFWGDYPNSSYPRHLAALDDQHLIFFAWSAVSGVELWRSDGTAAGTQLVRDIWPGDGGSLMQEDSDDLYGSGAPIFKKAKGKLWFFACDPDAGCEPWGTDGTEAGTKRLKDVVPGMSGSAMSYFQWGMYPRYSGPRFGVLKDRLYFGAFHEGSGFELWSSDGTGDGTQLLKELLPGDGYEASLFDSFTSAGDSLYFIGCKANGYDRFRDCALWRTDGTVTGTEPALANPLNFDGDGYYFTGRNRMVVAGSNLYVPATDDEHGAELFRIPVAVDPARLLGSLYDQVVRVAPGASLASKVAQARSMVARGQIRAACGVIAALANEIEAQKGKKLSVSIAERLGADVADISGAIGCN